MAKNLPTNEMIDVAIKAAQAAGKLLRETFQKPGFAEYSYKDLHNIVSESDKAAEAVILNTIHMSFPDHSIFSEEAGLISRKSDYLWMIDPLDGTTNFTHNIPLFSVSIGLIKENAPVLAVVFAPVTNELFSAQKNKGAYCNGEPIEVGHSESLLQTFVTHERGGNKAAKERFGKIFEKITSTARSNRAFGSAAITLCYVASGRFDAWISNNCKRYDCAAGNLIAQEAGALVTDFAGNPFDWSRDESDVLVTNNALQTQFVDILKHL